MADYPPPTQILPDFNPAVFRTNDIPLTIAEAENYFLSFPTAQGTQNFGTINVAGTLNVTGTLDLPSITADTASFDITNTGDMVLGVPTTKAIQFQVATLPKMTFTDTTSTFETGALGDILLSVDGFEKLTINATTTELKENAVIISGAGTINTTNPTTKATVFGFETTIPTGTGEHNTAFGYRAGKGFSTLTTTGGNTAFGALAMSAANIEGATNNTAIGHNSLLVLTTGDSNTAVGVNSANTLTTGSENTCIGFGAKTSSATNNLATAVGKDATATTNGTAIGSGTVANGSQAVAIGRSASCSGSNSVSLGNSTSCSASNSVSIGTNVSTTTANTITLGTTNETIRYNRVSPLYTTYSPSTSAHIGYTTTATITYPTTTTNVIASLTSVPAGLWLIQVMLNMNDGPAIINVRNGGTEVGFIPATTRTTDWYSGSVITTISTGTATLDILPLAAGVTGTDASGAGQSVRFTRLA
jgi:hypothetical protein